MAKNKDRYSAIVRCVIHRHPFKNAENILLLDTRTCLAAKPLQFNWRAFKFLCQSVNIGLNVPTNPTRHQVYLQKIWLAGSPLRLLTGEQFASHLFTFS